MLKVDRILYNGEIYTLAKEGEYVSAIAIWEDEIVETGSDEEILAIPAKEIIDLKGRTVLPGFIRRRHKGYFGSRKAG